ncbi:hypothetical protein NC651_032123 [Populus alba x Populus x berolinensis]|nr:hypothetical protein NC651_032120 [Populus alba x Populus x berolinensis]KAJ6873161.1 hypothetical protein NC651_032123 [Populus alba x Populus x berolinensis]
MVLESSKICVANDLGWARIHANEIWNVILVQQSWTEISTIAASNVEGIARCFILPSLIVILGISFGAC